MTTLNDDPYERSTAGTDLLIAVAALGEFAALRRVRKQHPLKVDLWSGTMAGLVVSGGLGAVVHGLALRDATRDRLWQPLYLSLGATVALFAAGAIADRWGPQATRRTLVPLLLSSVICYLISRRTKDFRVFLAYEALAMLFALIVYGTLAQQGRLRGAKRMLGGILLTIVAAGVQVTDAKMTIGGIPFDHNGLFHLVQLAGLPLLGAGVRAGLPEH